MRDKMESYLNHALENVRYLSRSDTSARVRHGGQTVGFADGVTTVHTALLYTAWRSKN